MAEAGQKSTGKGCGWLGLTFIAIAAFGLGWASGVGVRSGAKVTTGGVAQESCTAAVCEKAELEARYRVLECSYVRLLRPVIRVNYLVEDWQGDLGVAGELTASGQPFPPPLPPLRGLSEAEIKRAMAGGENDVCPFFYPARDEPERERFEIPVVD